MSKTKTPVQITEVSALSYIFGVTSQATMGRIGRENLAKQLLPFAMKAKIVSSIEDTNETGIYRVNGSSDGNLPDGAPFKYSLVVTFNIEDIYKIVFSHMGSVAYIFIGISGVKRTTMLGSMANTITNY